MILYPAIDLYDGMAVRLRQGRYDDMTVYDRDPKSLALRMRDIGATHLHMVDLEGARSGSTANLGLIEQIACTSGLFIELGGGIRSMDTIRRYLDCGISRTILGTAAVEDESLLREALETFGEHDGLGLLRGSVVPMQGTIPPELKIPQMGWNALIQKRSHPLLRDVKEGDCVYFVHSFYAADCDDSLVATTEYGRELTAVAARENVMGCQFHPEKSGRVGLSILRAFAEMA